MRPDKQWMRIPAMLAGAMLASATASGDSTTVIGKPFRISASVKTYCAIQPPALMCTVFQPQLAEFMAEKREAPWAAPVETLIEKSMRVEGKAWIEIRALECRRTLCALEYAVPVGDLSRDVDGSEELDRLVEAVGGVVIPELPSGTGQGKIVTVLLWRKL